MWLSLLSKVLGLLSGPVTQFFTGININSILSELWISVQKYWKFYLVGLVIVLQLLSGYEWYHQRTLYQTEQIAHKTDINNFKKAQAEADAQAQTEATNLNKESKANADEADAKYATLLASYRINLLRYKANQSAAKPSGNSDVQSTQGGDGPRGGADIPDGSLNISGEDAQICAVNTARLQAVHDWAINPPKDGDK